MAATSAETHSSPERDSFVKALVAALCAAGEARGIECEFNPATLAVSPAGDATRAFFLRVWLDQWAVHVDDSGSDREAAEDDIKQRAVAMFTKETLKGLASPGDTVTASEHTSSDPGVSARPETQPVVLAALARLLCLL